MIRFYIRVLLFVVLSVVVGTSKLPAEDLQVLENCTLIETSWADGDSFLVQDQTGKQFTLRLYAADCLEWHVHDTTDARRLRAQRRYFGISSYGDSAQSSIAAAKKFGEAAAVKVREELSQPFTVATAFADARGDGKHQRFYGFVTTSKGKDLGELLVRAGLARAFGVYRKTLDGRSREEYRQWMGDLELWAIKKGNGVWAATDWDALPAQRRAEHIDVAELQLATQGQPIAADFQLDINAAPRDELMRLPGIGEVIANRIIENRPYRSVDALLKVPGVGEKTLSEIRNHLVELK